jgi:hypothetical protein
VKNIKGHEIIKTVISDEFGTTPSKAVLFQKIWEQIDTQTGQFEPQNANPIDVIVTNTVLDEPVKRHRFIWQTMPAIAALLLIIGGGAMGLHLLSRQDTPSPPDYTTTITNMSSRVIESPPITTSPDPETRTPPTGTATTAPTTAALDSDYSSPAERTTTGDTPGTSSATSPADSTPAVSTVPTTSTSPATRPTSPATNPTTPTATSPTTTSPPTATNSHGYPIMWVCRGCARQNCLYETPACTTYRGSLQCGWCSGMKEPYGFGIGCQCDFVTYENFMGWVVFCMGCGKMTGENEIQECWPDPCNMGERLYCHTTGRLMEGCNCHHCQTVRMNHIGGGR